MAGNPVAEKEFWRGRLDKILLDTNVLSPILDGVHLSAWLEAVLANSNVAVAQFSIAEHLCSRRALQTSYQDAAKALENRGIAVLNGPCSNRASTELLYDTLVFERKVAPSKPTITKAAKQPGKSKPHQASWKRYWKTAGQNMPSPSQVMREAMRSLITKDGEFCKHFATSLARWGLTTYLVPAEALLK